MLCIKREMIMKAIILYTTMLIGALIVTAFFIYVNYAFIQLACN